MHGQANVGGPADAECSLECLPGERNDRDGW